MSVRTAHRLGFCMSALAFLAATGTAQAQDTETDPSSTASGTVAGKEIIVTARGRNETLQSAPVSVTSFDSQALDDARIKDVADFAGITPNISIVEAQSAGISFITIRGISQVRNGESPVAVVTDGVQQISSRQFTSDLFDVDQIQVLRGPQGALYGRNAIGGAIIITTKQPTNDFHLDAQISAGNGNDYRGEVAVSGPIIRDKLLFRVAGSARNFGGLLHNDYLNQTMDRVRDRNIRGQLKAYLSDTLTADLRGSYTHTSAIPNQYQYQGALFAEGSCYLDDTNPFGGAGADANRVSRHFCANNRGSNTRDIAEGSLKLTNEADWGTITNVFSYIHTREYVESDQYPYSASRNVSGTDGTQTQYETVKSWQNDFRIASPDSNRLRWMMGTYILGTRRFISTTTGQDNGEGIVNIYRHPQYDSTVNPTLTYLADDNKNLAYAFYGNLSYDVTNKLEAAVAFRYDHDHRHQMIDPQSSSGLPDGCTVAGSAACSRYANFNKAEPKITLNYKATPDLTVFADWGIGFRSGQFNQAGTTEAAGSDGAYSDLAKAESAQTSEAGIKASLLDGKLHINASGFYTIDKNPFYYVFVASVGAQILVNIDKVHLYGGEIEVSLTPIEGLDLFGNYGYTHSEIRQFDYNPDNEGNWAPYIPRDSGTIGAQYRFAVTDTMNLFARGEMEHHGKQYWDPDNSSARNAFQLINLHGGIEAGDGSWSVTAYVNNLADKKYNAEFVTGGFVQPAEPRTWGVELRTSL